MPITVYSIILRLPNRAVDALSPWRNAILALALGLQFSLLAICDDLR